MFIDSAEESTLSTIAKSHSDDRSIREKEAGSPGDVVHVSVTVSPDTQPVLGVSSTSAFAADKKRRMKLRVRWNEG